MDKKDALSANKGELYPLNHDCSCTNTSELQTPRCELEKLSPSLFVTSQDDSRVEIIEIIRESPEPYPLPSKDSAQNEDRGSPVQNKKNSDVVSSLAEMRHALGVNKLVLVSTLSNRTLLRKKCRSEVQELCKLAS